MKSVFAIVAFLFAVTVSAEQFKTVKFDDSVDNYISEITIQQILPGTVVVAYDIINQELLADIRAYGCSAEDAVEMEMAFDYTVDARIIALNQNYVSYEIAESSYCGGAHPNHGTSFKTFNSKTGALVDLEASQVIQHSTADYDVYAQFKTELAEVAYQYGQKALIENGCYEGTKEEIIETLSFFYPYIAGLADDKKVVLSVSVPHVASPCALSMNVPLSAVEQFFKKDSEVFSLLNY